MTRPTATSLIALLALAVAITCSALLAWVLLEPRDWFSDAYGDEKTVASLQAELVSTRQEADSLQRRVDALEKKAASDRPYIRGVGALCHALRNVNWPRSSEEEYAIVVARSVVDGLGDSCDWAEVPADLPRSR